jgi:hypothetical protein
MWKVLLLTADLNKFQREDEVIVFVVDPTRIDERHCHCSREETAAFEADLNDKINGQLGNVMTNIWSAEEDFPTGGCIGLACTDADEQQIFGSVGSINFNYAARTV